MSPIFPPGTLTVEQIYQDRDQFAKLVREVAAPDVGRMGIEILSFTIKVQCRGSSAAQEGLLVGGQLPAYNPLPFFPRMCTTKWTI